MEDFGYLQSDESKVSLEHAVLLRITPSDTLVRQHFKVQFATISAAFLCHVQLCTEKENVKTMH